MSHFLFGAAVAGIALAPVQAGDGSLKHLSVKVESVMREALVHVPAAATRAAAPVVFVFHGHGGSMRNAAADFGLHQQWPEAICVYMQGLPTPSPRDPKGEQPGWQHGEGEHGDRDLKFFDATLAHLRSKYRVDRDRIFATGFSNGGGFTFLLWAKRAEVLAAVAPCGSRSGRRTKDLTPIPCLHIAGRKDDVVDFEGQQKTMQAVRMLNQCDSTGQPWNKGAKITCTLYPSKLGKPFVSAIHPGGHEVPAQAGRLIVRFFKENARKQG